MQNIFTVIDTHSIKHVINHIIPDSIFKKIYISLGLFLFLYSGSSINLWTMTLRYGMIYCGKRFPFSNSTTVSNFIIFFFFSFLKSFAYSTFPPPPSCPLPLYASQIRRTPTNFPELFLLFVFCFYFIFLFYFYTTLPNVLSFTGSDFLHLFTFEKLLPESPFPPFH